jgi:hypothetical protein
MKHKYPLPTVARRLSVVEPLNETLVPITTVARRLSVVEPLNETQVPITTVARRLSVVSGAVQSAPTHPLACDCGGSWDGVDSAP